MLTLNLSNIFLNQSAENKLEVIELIGQKMVEAGYTAEAYTLGLKMREAISSTFLGNGIAIPTVRRTLVMLSSKPAWSFSSFLAALTGVMVKKSIWLSA